MPKLKKTKRQQTAADIKYLFKSGLAKKDWTQEHLAKVMGKAPAVISRAFNDPFKRDFGLLYDIAEKLGVDLSKALGGDLS
ncbi:MAG: helix-turn-helix transcriptional regulator [Acutalibacteraceae bacterium]|nr:helix-turn-helix transcriptional regulator [Acutalibacteraceae bacterium]